MTDMALAGRVLGCIVTSGPRISLRGVLCFVIFGSACGRIFSDESIPETALGRGNEGARDGDSWLESEDIPLPDIGVFAEDLAAPAFHQLALTESVKNKGDVCLISELQSVPVRTHGGPSGNFSSGELTGGEVRHKLIGPSGCTRSFHLCARNISSHEDHSSWIHLGKHSVIDIGHPCSIAEQLERWVFICL